MKGKREHPYDAAQSVREEERSVRQKKSSETVTS
jgi:hypothetical protein